MRTFTLIVMLAGLAIMMLHTRAGFAAETECSSSEKTGQAGGSGQDSESGEAMFRHLYDETGRLRQLAAAKGAEWLNTENLLARSLEKADRCDWETAIQLVKKAKLQVTMALKQSETEAQAWKHRVVD